MMLTKDVYNLHLHSLKKLNLTYVVSYGESVTFIVYILLCVSCKSTSIDIFQQNLLRQTPTHTLQFRNTKMASSLILCSNHSPPPGIVMSFMNVPLEVKGICFQSFHWGLKFCKSVLNIISNISLQRSRISSGLLFKHCVSNIY